MTSVDSNFNFLCGRPHGAGPPPPVHMRPPEPDSPPPPCGRHKWMAPSCKWPIVAWEIKKTILKLPEKSKIYPKFAWKSKFFGPGSTTPQFQTRFTPMHQMT